MTGYGPNPRWEEVDSDPVRGDHLPIENGKSVTLVTGVAGVGLRVCTEGKEYNEWWGRALCTNTVPPLTSYGAVFCKFNYNGNRDQAYCELKLVNGQILDRFFIISRHIPRKKAAKKFRVQNTLVQN